MIFSGLLDKILITNIFSPRFVTFSQLLRISTKRYWLQPLWANSIIVLWTNSIIMKNTEEPNTDCKYCTEENDCLSPDSPYTECKSECEHYEKHVELEILEKHEAIQRTRSTVLNAC